MPEASDPTAPAAKKTRKAPARKTAPAKSAAAGAKKATAPSRKRTSAAKASTPTFADAAGQARAAMNTASAAARAKVTDATGKASSNWKAQSDKLKGQGEKAKAQGEQIYAQAGKMARDAAGRAKAQTGTAMQSLAKLISDTADTVDTKLGPQYGDYARQAASAVAAGAKSLDDRDIDQLLDEARNFVRKSPAVAIGAAAIAGYVLMRLARGSGNEGSDDA